MQYHLRSLIFSAILAISCADGSADCNVGGLGSLNAKGIDPTFMKQTNVPVQGPVLNYTGVNIEFDTFNCDQVIKTGDALTRMVQVGIRPVDCLIFLD